MRQDSIRKNQGAGVATSVSSERLNVVAPAYVQAKQTDPSGIVNALNSFANRKKNEQAQLAAEAERRAERQAVLDKEEQDKLTAAQGRSDQTLGNVDEDRMKVDELYAENVRVQQVEADGLTMMGSAIPELDAAMESPDFNLREWQQAKLQEMSREPGSLGARSLAAQNGFASQFLQQTTLHYAARQKDQLDKAATVGFNNLLFAGLRTGNASLKDLAILESRGASVGLTPEEVTSQVGKSLLDLYSSTGNAKYYKLAEQRGLLDTAEFGGDFLKQKAIIDEKWRAEREKAKTRDALDALQLYQQLDEMSQNHTLTPAFVSELVKSGRITLSQGEGWLGRQNTDLRAETAKAEAAAAKAAKEKEIADAVAAEMATVQSSFEAGQDALALAMSKNPDIPKKRWEDYANKKYATAVESLGAAHQMPDGPERDAAVAAAATTLNNAMRQAHAANMLPAMVQSTFSGISLDTPQRVVQLSKVYEDMKASGMGNFIRDNIPAGSYVVLESFRGLAEQVGPEEAVRLLADGRRPLDEVVSTVNGMAYRELAPIAKELSDDYDGNDSGTIEAALKQSAMASLLAGVPRDQVAELAKQHFQDHFTPFDGSPIPRSHIAHVDEESLQENAPAFVRDVLLPEIQEYASVSEVRLSYLRGRPGKFMLTSPSIPGDGIVRNPDGTMKVVDARDMIKRGSEARMAERKRLAEVLWESTNRN